MKTCSKCKQEKPLEEFQKRKASKDGFTAACKQCLSEYDKQRANLPHRVKAREEYAKTEQGRIAGNRAKKKFRESNPVKAKAHNMVSNAIRDGELKKEPCMICNSSDVQAHHPDYTKPLDVVWLCPLHHSKIHQYEKRVEEIRQAS